MVTNQGESSPVVRNVMTLDTCAAIIGSEVMSFKTEQKLLTVILPLPPLHVWFCCDVSKFSVLWKKAYNRPFSLNPPNVNMDYAVQLLMTFIVCLEMACIA